MPHEEAGLMPLYRKFAAACIPVKVRLELTRLCNLRCAHCKVNINTKSADEITPTELESILTQLIKAGTFELNITGGEVFSRPDIIELLDVIFSHNFLVHIQTNGSLLTDRHFDLLDRHRERLSRIGVSLYSSVPEVHEAVTGIPGSFDKTVHTIKTLKEMGIRTSVFTMLMSINASTWRETEKLMNEMGLPHQFGAMMVAREDGCTTPLDLLVSEDELSSLPIPWEKFVNAEPKNAPEYLAPDASISNWCVAARFCCILPTAEVCPCTVIRTPVGSLREISFEEIWNNAPLLKELRAMKVGDLECMNCNYFPRCRPCIGLAHQEKGSFTAVPSGYCRLTKTFMKPVK